MIRSIIDASLANRFPVLLAWLLFCYGGIRSLEVIPVDAVPDVTNVQVQILTNSPGLAPAEVERFITFPVETAMSGIPMVEEIRSVSKFGLSVVTVVFEETTDIYWARQQVGERLTEARERIPKGYGEPEMGPISSGLGEIYQFEVRGDEYTPMELRTILDWSVNFQLRSVPGIVEVNSFGGELKTYQVTMDPKLLWSFGLSVGEVLEAIERNNRNVGGGYIEHMGEQLLVRGEGLIQDLGDLGAIVVKVSDGVPVYIRDLGTVEFAPMIRQGAITRDGRGEAVVGIVMMILGGNSRTIVADVKAKLEELKKTLPPGVTIEPFYDRTELVDRTIKTVGYNLVEGALLVALVLFLLLGDLRAGLLVASAIPFSFLGAILGMRWMGLSANLMSLGAVDFGIIVDGSVVMVENIVRVLSELRGQRELTKIEKVRQAAHEVARPTVFSVMIIMIVYIPVLALRGIEGKMFRPMAWTVVFALATSLVCAITLMPVLASFLLSEDAEETEPFLFRMAKRAYEPILFVCRQNPLATVALAFAMFIASLGLGSTMGGEFIPRLDEGAIAMQVWRLPSVSLEESNRISGEAEKVLVAAFPEVKTVVSRTGRAEIATDPMGVEISDVFVMLHPPSTWRYKTKEALVEAMDTALKAKVPGAAFSYSQPIELRVAELISGVRSDVAIKIYGDDLNMMKNKADEIVAAISKVRGAADAKAEQTVGLPLLRIIVDREAVARYGLNAEDVLEVIEAIGGKNAGVVIEGQKRFDIQLRFEASLRSDPDRIGEILVSGGAEGRSVQLSQVATIRLVDGPAQISRENISRRTTVEVNVRGRDLASFVAEAKQVIDRDVKLPSGWVLDWGGQFENLEEASGRLALLVPIALLLIFALLQVTFGSLSLSALIYMNLPMAATGGILGLYLRGFPFSISAGIGFISLFGVAVMNGVVLVSCAQDRRREGLSPEEAAPDAARSRLRPVLMSALTDIIGFLPMAVATSAGAEVQQPLATVVIGGLLLSMGLTLLVIPAVYPWFDRGDHIVQGDT